MHVIMGPPPTGLDEEVMRCEKRTGSKPGSAKENPEGSAREVERKPEAGGGGEVGGGGKQANTGSREDGNCSVVPTVAGPGDDLLGLGTGQLGRQIWAPWVSPLEDFCCKGEQKNGKAASG